MGRKNKVKETESLNRSLHAAKSAKKDEFYTQVDDIEKELRHYKEHFAGKVVLCNCDDPRVSGFWDYFSKNFEHLKLKKLIATCYKNQDYDLFSQHDCEKGIALTYEGDRDGNRIPNDAEIEKHRLKGDGDFRSPECIELLKQADIVVTNPPFSLFGEYVTQLAESGKKFLVIGNHNAITYKEIFKLIKENKLWLGNTQPVKFQVPDDYELREVRSWRDENGTNWRSLGNACWFTNMDFARRHDDITLFKSYGEKEYPSYENYQAIEVAKVADIPVDYDGVMGVPITFLDKYNPEQFEIVGTTESNDRDNAFRTRFYTSRECRDAYEERFGRPGVYDLNASGVVNGVKVFKRVLIRKRQK